MKLQDFFPHDVDLRLEILVSPDGVVHADAFICKQVQDVSALDLLQVEILLRGYHLLDLVLLLIELHVHLLALVL